MNKDGESSSLRLPIIWSQPPPRSHHYNRIYHGTRHLPPFAPVLDSNAPWLIGFSPLTLGRPRGVDPVHAHARFTAIGHYTFIVYTSTHITALTYYSTFTIDHCTMVLYLIVRSCVRPTRQPTEVCRWGPSRPVGSGRRVPAGDVARWRIVVYRGVSWTICD